MSQSERTAQTINTFHAAIKRLRKNLRFPFYYRSRRYGLLRIRVYELIIFLGFFVVLGLFEAWMLPGAWRRTNLIQNGPPGHECDPKGDPRKWFDGFPAARENGYVVPLPP